MEEIKGFENEETIEVLDDEIEEVEKKMNPVIEKGKKFGSKVFNKGKDIFNYCKENPGEAAEKAVTAIGVAFTGAMVIAAGVKASNASKTVYSKEIGEDVLLKKKLSNADKVELDYRMSNGQTKIEALNAMNKIKK